MAIALLLPLAFNPYAKAAFEPVKVSVFNGIVAAMVFSLIPSSRALKMQITECLRYE